MGDNFQKDFLRKQLLKQRRELSPSLAQKWSEWVQMHFLGSQCYLYSKTIALYASIDHEVDTRMIFERSLKEGKIVVFPRMVGIGEMVFLKVEDYEKMQANRFGILEPRSGSKKFRLEELDLVVVPGVAFDRRGYRLGFGGGYYDRVLSRLGPEVLTVGFAYSFQLLDLLPTDEHDQKVKRLVTEQGFIRLNPERD